MESLVRFDWAMKRLLRDKSNYVVLEGFLSTLLGEDLRILRFLESESNQETEDDKFKRKILLSGKGMDYGDEDSFENDYPSYDEIFRC